MPSGTRRITSAGLSDARWVIVDLIGKGRRVRKVPMPSWAKHAIDAWMAGSAIYSGFIFRRMDRAGRVIGESLAARSIFHIVRRFGSRIDVPNPAPHDLRRTFAKLARRANPL